MKKLVTWAEGAAIAGAMFVATPVWAQECTTSQDAMLGTGTRCEEGIDSNPARKELTGERPVSE